LNSLDQRMVLSIQCHYTALNTWVQHFALLCILRHWMYAADPSEAGPVRTASLYWYLTLGRTTSDDRPWLAM
jgi:hypothetical protein